MPVGGRFWHGVCNTNGVDAHSPCYDCLWLHKTLNDAEPISVPNVHLIDNLVISKRA